MQEKHVHKFLVLGGGGILGLGGGGVPILFLWRADFSDKNVIVSVIWAKLIPVGIPRCNCNQRVFGQELLHFSRINSARD